VKTKPVWKKSGFLNWSFPLAYFSRFFKRFTIILGNRWLKRANFGACIIFWEVRFSWLK
jgi:hypothetical protein